MENKKYFDDEISHMRKIPKNGTELVDNPMWVSSVRKMFIDDCNSLSACEFLLNKADDKKTQNVQIIAMLLLSALMDVSEEKKTSLLAFSIDVRDIATTIEDNFEDYEVAVSFFSKIDGAIEFSIIAQK